MATEINGKCSLRGAIFVLLLTLNTTSIPTMHHDASLNPPGSAADIVQWSPPMASSVCSAQDNSSWVTESGSGWTEPKTEKPRTPHTEQLQFALELVGLDSSGSFCAAVCMEIIMFCNQSGALSTARLFWSENIFLSSDRKSYQIAKDYG